jgi:hypothetical protein
MATKPLKAPRPRAKDPDKGRKVAVRVARETTTMAAAALVAVDKPLTVQQKLFTKYWAEGDTIPNAMHRAGYNDQPSYGYRMAKMPNVLALKAKYQKEFEEASKMTKKRVIDMQLEAYEAAKQLSEPASMVSAAREIGKLCGYYEPTKVSIDVNVSGGTLDKLSRLSDEDLLKMIEQGDSVGLLEGPATDPDSSPSEVEDEV